MNKSRPLIIAHRGASYDAPENTVAAINLAWERGAQAVEIDIQLSRDNEIIVIHDYSTARTTGHKAKVKKLDVSEVKKLDAGSWKGKRWEGEPVPTLKEVMATVPARRILVIEIKDGPEILPVLQRQLEESLLDTDQLIIIGFDLKIVQMARQLFPEIRVLWLRALAGKISDQQVQKIIADTCEAGLDGINLQATEALDNRFVQQARDNNLLVFTWTVNSAAMALKLKKLEIDAITTDRPAWLARKLDN